MEGAAEPKGVVEGEAEAEEVVRLEATITRLESAPGRTNTRPDKRITIAREVMTRRWLEAAPSPVHHHECVNETVIHVVFV